MPRCVRIGLLLAAVAFGATGLAGRGGGKTEKATSTATRAAATEPRTSLPQATGTPVAGAFRSYHYTVTLTFAVNDPEQPDSAPISGTVEGDYDAPDSHAFTNSFQFAGLSSTEQVVIIGDQAWYKDGDSGWRATTRADERVQDALGLTSADPGFLQDPEFESDISTLDSERERIHGVDTRRYHIPKEAVDELARLLGEDFLEDASGLEDFEMTVWLEEETGGMVRAALTATGSPEVFGSDFPFTVSPDAMVSIEMTIDLTRIDDESISIVPPI